MLTLSLIHLTATEQTILSTFIGKNVNVKFGID